MVTRNRVDSTLGFQFQSIVEKKKERKWRRNDIRETTATWPIQYSAREGLHRKSGRVSLKDQRILFAWPESPSRHNGSLNKFSICSDTHVGERKRREKSRKRQSERVSDCLVLCSYIKLYTYSLRTLSERVS